MQMIVLLKICDPTTPKNSPLRFTINAGVIRAHAEPGQVTFEDGDEAGSKTLAVFQISEIIGYYSPDAVKEG